MPALACAQPDTRACSIEAFRDRHAGESVIACGCGSSLSSLLPRPGLVTIGVNDVGRLFDPNSLVVVNPPLRFYASESYRVSYRIDRELRKVVVLALRLHDVFPVLSHQKLVQLEVFPDNGFADGSHVLS